MRNTHLSDAHLYVFKYAYLNIRRYLYNNILELLCNFVNVSYSVFSFSGASIVVSDRLTFLGKYREFIRLREEADYQAAASLLHSLLWSRLAPKYFWVTLLIDSIPFLTADQVLYFVETSIWTLMSVCWLVGWFSVWHYFLIRQEVKMLLSEYLFTSSIIC